MSLDGGSAAPPTADVPTCGDQLAIEPDNCTYVCSEPADHDGPHFDSHRSMSWTRLPDHSGVAGEPEATPSKGSESVQNAAPIETPTTTPDQGSAVNVAGGVSVPDEAVEAGARADHAFGRLNFSDDPDWDDLSDADRDSYRRANRAALTAAAPLIVEHYLRSRIKAAEPDHDDARLWEHIAEMSRASALRTAMVDVLRATYWALRERSSAFRSAGGNEPHARGLDEAAALVEKRLTELEWGGDR